VYIGGKYTASLDSINPFCTHSDRTSAFPVEAVFTKKIDKLPVLFKYGGVGGCCEQIFDEGGTMYEVIARYYDLLGWGEFHDVSYPRLLPLLTQTEAQSYLDLACGTGSLAFSIAERGLDVVGLDRSQEMLTIAKQRLRGIRKPLRPRFVHADMTDFNMNRCFDAVGCFFDSVNHVTEPEAVQGLFDCAFTHLNPGGFFIFDVNTVVGMRQWDAALFSKEGLYALMMGGEYDGRTRLAKVTVAGHVILDGQMRDAFRSIFYERAYPHKDILSFLRKTGFRRSEARPLNPEHTMRTADRVFYIAHRQAASG
jgi:SAM-dependent methyltransferase